MNTKILEDFQICIVVPLKHPVATKKSKSFVNLGIGTSAMESESDMELELELILQTSLFPVSQGL